MISMSKQSGNTSVYVNEYIADTTADLDDLKKETKDAAVGSTCLCLEDSSVWALGGDKEWHEL